MNKIGFIFDLDGVIVDTAKYHYLAWKKTADKLGIHFTKEHNELLKGVSRVASLEIILGLGDAKITEDQKTQILIDKNTDYLVFIAAMTTDEILPGVLEVLSFLEENKIPFALGSASKNASLILKKVNLLDRFKAIVDGTHVSKAKPDPEVFLLAAEQLNVAPKDCVVFEDAIAGVQAAKAAKMLAIGIGDAGLLHEADYVFTNVSDVTTAFLASIVAEIIL